MELIKIEDNEEFLAVTAKAICSHLFFVAYKHSTILLAIITGAHQQTPTAKMHNLCFLKRIGAPITKLS